MASGLSADGAVVIGTSNDLPVRWTAAGVQNLGVLPSSGTAVYTAAHGVSADGSVVVGTSLSSNQAQAFEWTATTGITALGGVAAGNDSQAYGVSADGTVIAGYAEISKVTQAVEWTRSAGMVEIGGSNSTIPSSIGEGVSGNGQVLVGIGNTASGVVGFRWTAASGMQNLNSNAVFGGIVTRRAYAANEDGSVIVGEGGLANGTTQAFRWTTTAGITGLGTLPGFSTASVALAVDADGSTIVGDANSASSDAVFIWDPVHGMQNLQQVLTSQDGLNLTGWTLIDALAISPDGQTIAGDGIDPAGHEEAWIATLPEPGGALLSTIAAFCMLVSTRRRIAASH
ncbi:MAG TPA: hypothetical protein VGG19_07180 [Tepidisphaeraceae bacterium]